MVRPTLLAMASLLVSWTMAQAQAVPASAPAGIANREALAWWYLRVDQAWEQARSTRDAAGARAAHEAFDTATLSFFKMDLSGAVRSLANLRNALEEPVPAAKAPVPISIEIEPRIWIPPATEPRVRLSSVQPDLAPDSFDLVVEARTHEGESLVRREVTVTSESLSRGEVIISGIDWSTVRDRMEATGAGVAAQRRPLIVQWTVSQADAAVGADRLIVSPWSLADRERTLLARLKALESRGGSMDQDRRMARSRAALLTDSPSRNKASEFLADYSTLPADVEREVLTIENGRSPYPLEGTWWTTVRAGKLTAPVWFSSPPERTPGRPLLVVFHGAGGDESMFVFGYGQGNLVREAVRRGMVVASPATGATMGSPRVFEALVREARRLYDIDPTRIFIAGHSMGAGAVSSLAQKYPSQLAGAVCFAGGNLDPQSPCCPTLILGGEVDPLIPGARLGRAAQACIEAGLPVTFSLCAGNGHTFIVGDQATVALDFLGQRRSEAAFAGQDREK